MVDTTVPVRVPLPAGLAGALSVATGDAHTCVVAGDAAGTPQVACFGANDRGQLGDGTTTARATAAGVVLGGAAPALPVAIAAGGAHSCASDGVGRLWCWGRGDRGQLGTGGTEIACHRPRWRCPTATQQARSRRAAPTPAPSISPGGSGAGARTTAGSSAPAGWRRRPGTSARRGAARCRRDGFGRRRAQLRLAERRTGLLLGRERERATRRRDDNRPRVRARSRGSTRDGQRPGRPTPARSRRTATRRAGARTPAGNWATA